MKKLIIILIMCIFTFGCSGLGHIGYMGKGKTKSEVLEAFGPPMRVDKSIKGVETWVYMMGSAVKTYTFQGDSCIKDGSRTQN